jgi:uncharacterized protein (DUF2147 family)
MLKRKVAMGVFLAACLAAPPGSRQIGTQQAGAQQIALQQISTQTPSMIGDWTEPTGSVIRVDHCGNRICMWLIALSKQVTVRTDVNNPNPKLRSRPLCDLLIGSGFIAHDATHATGGMLYDPKTGGSYRGLLSVQDSTLTVRGYLGAPFFGRSETWPRTTGAVKFCAGASPH